MCYAVGMAHIVENEFGQGSLVNIEDLSGKIYIQCSACMSLYAEALSWANAHPDRIVTSPWVADHIITLSCQVTDLAVYNDLQTVQRARNSNRDKEFYVAGCLAHRFDIPLPGFLHRMDHFRKDYQYIKDKELVRYVPPFWVKDFHNNSRLKQNSDGYRMRGMYPLRIGVGCTGKCTYCTIRTTRGKPYTLDDLDRLEEEFLDNYDVVLISDNPSSQQIKHWCDVAIKYQKSVSFRNVEPLNAMRAWSQIEKASFCNQLKMLHVPVQSLNPDVLASMGRKIEATMHFAVRAQTLRKRTTLATSIIIAEDDPFYYQVDTDAVYELFDTVSWNPMWNGVWNEEKAKEKFMGLFPWHQER